MLIKIFFMIIITIIIAILGCQLNTFVVKTYDYNYY